MCVTPLAAEFLGLRERFHGVLRDLWPIERAPARIQTLNEGADCGKSS